MDERRRGRLIGGGICIVLGLFEGLIMYRHPEKLHVPAGMAVVLCLAFVAAGLAIIAAEYQLRRLHAWLVVMILVGLLVPGAWIAFGAGEHHCIDPLPFLNTFGAELLCRGAFGIGAVLVAAILGWVVRLALRGNRR